MARGSNRVVLIALVVLVVIVAAIRLFGGPLYETLVRLHGPGGGH
jgi:ABC-type methionine transport system permease subunit